MKPDLKGVLLYAVLPALIAGVFAVAPKLYDIITEPRASLRFLITTGPIVRLPSGVKQIVSASVWNDGRLPLTEVKFILNSESGTTIEATTFEQATGLSSQVSDGLSQTTYDITGLLPGERFSVASMLTAEEKVNLPQISVRSKEALGVLAEGQLKQELSIIDFVGGLLASISVFSMALVLKGKVRSGGLSWIGGKQDILFYIPARLNLPEIAKEMQLADTSLTYFRMADILLAHGLEAEADVKSRTIKALKCILLVEGIAENSLCIVEENLKILEGTEFSSEEIKLLRNRCVPVSDQILLRRTINDFIASGTVFLEKAQNDKQSA